MIGPKTLTIFQTDNLSYGNTYFGLTEDKDVLRTYPCRIEYQYFYLRDKPKFAGYYYKNLDINKLSAFWKNIEDRLKLKNKTVIYKTNIDGAIVMKLARFWVRDILNQSISINFNFAITLRCGI